jgi:hypothetical protein
VKINQVGAKLIQTKISCYVVLPPQAQHRYGHFAYQVNVCNVRIPHEYGKNSLPSFSSTGVSSERGWIQSGKPSHIFLLMHMKTNWGTAVAQWLRYCASNLKVTGSISDGVIGIFH